MPSFQYNKLTKTIKLQILLYEILSFMLNKNISHFLVVILIFTGLAALFLILGKILSKKSLQDREFQSPFECGFSTFNDHRLKFSLHFFLIALVFIIFDVELIILFPFYNHLVLTSPIGVTLLFILFLFILTLGLVNE